MTKQEELKLAREKVNELIADSLDEFREARATLIDNLAEFDVLWNVKTTIKTLGVPIPETDITGVIDGMDKTKPFMAGEIMDKLEEAEKILSGEVPDLKTVLSKLVSAGKLTKSVGKGKPTYTFVKVSAKKK